MKQTDYNRVEKSILAAVCRSDNEQMMDLLKVVDNWFAESIFSDGKRNFGIGIFPFFAFQNLTDFHRLKRTGRYFYNNMVISREQYPDIAGVQSKTYIFSDPGKSINISFRSKSNFIVGEIGIGYAVNDFAGDGKFLHEFIDSLLAGIDDFRGFSGQSGCFRKQIQRKFAN